MDLVSPLLGNHQFRGSAAQTGLDIFKTITGSWVL
jgi:hypothetical protein